MTKEQLAEREFTITNDNWYKRNAVIKERTAFLKGLQVGMEFVVWVIHKGYWAYENKPNVWKDMGTGKEYTTEELFEIFINEHYAK